AMPFAVTALPVLLSLLRSRPSGSAANWLRAGWGELGAAWQVFLLQQPWVLLPPRVRLGRQDRIAVLLVHGYGCNHRVWDGLARRLDEAGHSVLSVDLEPLFCSIDDYALRIDEAVSVLCRASGAHQVALVGHSMGGLAIRAWLRRFGHHRAAVVLTLGTPHAGTYMARGAPTTNGRQMDWQSPWLQALAAGEGPGTRRLMHLAWTHEDNIVFPQDQQCLDGASQVRFEGIGHLQMTRDPDVARWILNELAGVPTQANHSP
ncbi:MAG: alpha/beta fold hydrolase, partial [Rhodoferax sp.]|nr:alpha/beta fold hydrolase [Rhodoferax sp.]